MFTVGILILWVLLLGDILYTRYGVWYKGMVEKNPLIRNRFYDLTKSGGLTFADCMLKFALVVVLAGTCRHYGLDNSGLIPFIACVAPAAVITRNALLLRKIGKK